METRIALFQKKEIRKTLHADEWWFVIVDVVAALTDSANPAGYLKDMRRRDPTLAEALKGGTTCPPPWPTASKGGATCPPPCSGVPHGRWPAKTHLLAYRRHFPPDPVHPQSQGRALQTLAR
jgi:hypothetical protein